MQKESELDRLERVRQLIKLYETQTITGTSLLNDVADCVTPASIDAVIDLIPLSLRPRLLRWIQSLPGPASDEMVVWPLPSGVTLAFKEWLKRQEVAPTDADRG
jgi:hypothetical protein